MSVPRTSALAPSDSNHAFHVFVIPTTLYYNTSAFTKENHGLRAAPESEGKRMHRMIYTMRTFTNLAITKKKAVNFHFVIIFLKFFFVFVLKL